VSQQLWEGVLERANTSGASVLGPTGQHRSNVNPPALSRSRVSRAVEAALRVGGGLIVAAALNVSGLRAGAGTPTDTGSERPAGREGDRRAEQRGTPLRGPARLVKQPVRHSAPWGSSIHPLRSA
jgi:hypothetical protein